MRIFELYVLLRVCLLVKMSVCRLIATHAIDERKNIEKKERKREREDRQLVATRCRLSYCCRSLASFINFVVVPNCDLEHPPPSLGDVVALHLL